MYDLHPTTQKVAIESTRQSTTWQPWGGGGVEVLVGVLDGVCINAHRPNPIDLITAAYALAPKVGSAWRAAAAAAAACARVAAVGSTVELVSG